MLEALSPTEIAKAATLFDNLKQLRIKLKNGDENVLERAFEFHVQGVLDKLDARLSNLNELPLQRVEIILARHGLYDAAFQQVVLLCQSISPALGDSVRDLRAVHSSFLTDFQQTVNYCTQDIHTLHQELQNFSNQLNSLSEENRKLEEIIQKLNQEADDQNNKILELRQHLRVAIQENQQIKELNPEILKKLSNTAYNFDTTLLPNGGGPTVYADPPIPPSPKPGMKRTNSTSSLSTPGMTAGAAPPSPHFASSRRKSNKLSTNSLAEELSVMGSNSFAGGYGGYGGNTSNNITGRGVPLALASPVAWIGAFREDCQRAIDEKKCRAITLNECKELIGKVYESKTVANEKAVQGLANANHPMETIEQHTYRILEKKYGLRTLALEHAGMLVQAMEQYASLDHEVLIFQKIFRNEIEENYRFVAAELLSSLKDLTLVQVMGRNTTKDVSVLHQLVEQKMSSGCVYEDEWMDMIQYLYNTQDAAALGSVLKRQAMLDRDLDNTVPTISVVSNNVPAPTTTHVLTGHTLSGHKVSRPNATYVLGTPNMSLHSSLQDAGMGLPTTPSGSASSVPLQLGYDRQSVKDSKRLGYSSSSLQINLKEINAAAYSTATHSASSASTKSKKIVYKLSFRIFVQMVLQYQLTKHQEYLSQFTLLFRQYDLDVDGVLSGAEFKEVFHRLWQQAHPRQRSLGEEDMRHGDGEDEEELRTLYSLVKSIDPFETDRFIFSSTVVCLQKLQS